MLDYYRNRGIYDLDIWLANGGIETRKNYQRNADFLERHLQWLDGLPVLF